MIVQAQSHSLAFSSAILRRGFWLYVWRISIREGGSIYYVGRTGDSSSLNAQSPFSRLSAHLGSNDKANALRRHLHRTGHTIENCENFELFTYGPLFGESKDRDVHFERRNKTAALEKALCDELRKEGFVVLNVVNCRHPIDEELWRRVREDFLKRLS
jgi:hypothetical protein